MGYMRAEDILPKDVLELVQQYADGQTIYIPRKSDCHKSWGAGTETKKALMIRNEQMYEEYQSGVTIPQLSARYFLTEKSVQRIIRNHKK
ncbi:MAG: hypothetical protein J1F42_13310 [Lachnospiraceae bacterium]|nr:hypothetical protein [Lachnospiraceae bacterium]